MTTNVMFGSTVRTVKDASGNVTGLSAGGVEIASGLQVYNPGALRAWRRKRARASAAGAGRPAVVAVVGDSMVFGIQANGAATEIATANADGTYVGDTNWCTFAAQIINARLGKVAPVAWDAMDARLTAVSANNVSSVGLNGRSKSLTSTTPSTLTFPATTCKRFEIGYFETTTALGDTATGGFSHDVDAAGAVAVATAGAVRAGKIATTAALASGSHTLVLTGTTAAPTYITHAIAYTDGGVALLRLGRGGWRLSDALGIGSNNALAQTAQDRLLSAYAAAGQFDMIMITYAHNDAMAYTPAQFGDYLDMIIGAAPSTLTIGLIAPPHPTTANIAGTYGTRTDYWDVMRDKAAANANVFHARMSSVFGTYDEAYADGLYSSGVHPSSSGYGLGGQFLADLLLL